MDTKDFVLTHSLVRDHKVLYKGPEKCPSCDQMNDRAEEGKRNCSTCHEELMDLLRRSERR